jgi:hypothetical protein
MAEQLLRYIYCFKKLRLKSAAALYLYNSSDIVTIPKEMYKNSCYKSIQGNFFKSRKSNGVIFLESNVTSYF